MSIENLQSGLLTTLQDAGRVGYRSLGIHSAGAMDLESMYLANALVGNPDETAVLEMHFPSGQFLFHSDACISITGADHGPQLNGTAIPRNSMLLIRAGSILAFTRPNKGARTYLSIAGGFQLNQWLKSHSTDLAAGAGGWNGRALVKGDRIPFVRSIQMRSAASMDPSIRCDVSPNSGPLNLLPGPDWDRLSQQQQENLIKQSWVVGSQSNRMGLRLRAAEPILIDGGSMISAATEYGTVQCLPNGELIVLMADHPVTGGYPRIAQVPYFEWSRLAQAIPGDAFNLQYIDHFYALEKNQYWMTANQTLLGTIRLAVQSYLQQHVTEC